MTTMPTTADLLPLLPELVLTGGAFALLMLDVFLDDRRRIVTHVLATFAAGVLVIGLWPKPLTDLMEPSIAHLASQLAASKL